MSTTPSNHANVKFPPPLMYVAVFLLGFLMQWLIPLPEVYLLLRWIGGGLLGAAGSVLVGWALWLFWQDRTNPLPHKPSRALVIRGPYRLTRNPMYVGMLFLYVGLALLLGNWWPVILVPLITELINRFVIQKEEAYLTQRFGGDYTRYQTRVGRWL
ncbi:Protein-S-isoprenylcysteine O-methyltransferase Ste14 [Catalinimonas alkaloidigena]|uniref:Protein-S-isoprenylcysteine O-methyltransferase Ste14 n=1 Tax=Catalinimonas alkaloidigena TaxID=1075417 RepID=A0A1G9R454_9BACT|nr:isoprenylcysteine carboxylmethyltransferase family protein [Catalinimonas alkaloidigena]SDM18092.1 Protein-S-isoprenylcysteine O-methyltransferase Ste14 [Catalinimonas alkaloidigena]